MPILWYIIASITVRHAVLGYNGTWWRYHGNMQYAGMWYRKRYPCGCVGEHDDKPLEVGACSLIDNLDAHMDPCQESLSILYQLGFSQPPQRMNPPLHPLIMFRVLVGSAWLFYPPESILLQHFAWKSGPFPKKMVRMAANIGQQHWHDVMRPHVGVMLQNM